MIDLKKTELKGKESLWVLTDAVDIGWLRFGGYNLRKVAVLLHHRSKAGVLTTFVRELTVGTIYKYNHEWMSLLSGLTGERIDQGTKYDFDLLIPEVLKEIKSKTYNLMVQIEKKGHHSEFSKLKVLKTVKEYRGDDMVWRDSDVKKYKLKSAIPDLNIKEEMGIDDETDVMPEDLQSLQEAPDAV